MKNENTILDNEKSQVNYNDDQATRIDNEETPQATMKTNRSVAATASTGKVIATGIGGVLLGTAISQAANYFTENGEEVIVEENPADIDDSEFAAQETPEWSTGSVDIATGVTDSMSFGEAFATARAEVGPGGAFEWNGNVYGTYYAEEWNNMTADEKADYNRQFNWGAIDTTNNEQIVNEIEATAEVPTPEPEINDEYIAEETQETFEATEVETDTEAEVEIEVLGIVNDAETGSTAVPLIVDGEPVVLVDIDDDPQMDIMIADINHNIEIEDNEILDISEYNISLDDIESCLEEDYDNSAVDYDLSMSDTMDYTDTMDI